MFSQSPSLSTMVVNKYKLKSNIKSLNLFGMGVVLVWYQLIWLEIFFKFKRTFVVNTKIINPNYYQGSKQSHASSKLFVFPRVSLRFLFQTKGMAESLPIIVYFGFPWLSMNKSILTIKVCDQVYTCSLPVTIYIKLVTDDHYKYICNDHLWPILCRLWRVVSKCRLGHIPL